MNQLFNNKDEGNVTKNFTIPQEDIVLLKKVQKMNIIALICAAVSLVIGGVLLSAVSLIIIWRAYVNLRPLNHATGDTALIVARLKRSMRITVIGGVLALGLNAFTVYMLWPQIQQIVQTGDWSTVTNGLSAGNASGGSGVSSTWG